MSLGLLVDAELQYRPGMEAVTSLDGRTGERIGDGDGRIESLRLKGTICWDIYEKDGVFTDDYPPLTTQLKTRCPQ